MTDDERRMQYDNLRSWMEECRAGLTCVFTERALSGKDPAGPGVDPVVTEED